jgi:predicted enzyme related to lactoylglutathione lyase
MKKHFLRGMATINYWADDVKEARDWYANLFDIEAYFQMPNKDAPAYAEFRIGDDGDEFGIVSSAYKPAAMQTGAGGSVLYWNVDNIEEIYKKLLEAGATECEPITKRGDSGFVTASVIDPFGNILGIMTNPHYVELHGGPKER